MKLLLYVYIYVSMHLHAREYYEPFKFISVKAELEILNMRDFAGCVINVSTY